MKVNIDGAEYDAAIHPTYNRYAASACGMIFSQPALSRKGMSKSSIAPRAEHWVCVSQFVVQAKYTPPYKKFRITQDGFTKIVSAHRFILECWDSVQPRKIVVRHLDGNPLNNNLKNLKYGTVKENVDDAFKHNGNYAEGTRNGRSKLTEDDVREIRNRYDSGERLSKISVDYPHITTVSVKNAAKRITWIHVD
jgi:hypothetical protein